MGFFKPGTKPNDTSAQAQVSSNPLNTTNPTAPMGSGSHNTNSTRVTSAVEKESFKIRPVTAGGARKKYTIKDLDL